MRYFCGNPYTAATGLFCRGNKIDGSLLKFCQRHATSLSGTAKCDLAKFKQPAVTFCLLVKIVRPRQCYFARGSKAGCSDVVSRRLSVSPYQSSHHRPSIDISPTQPTQARRRLRASLSVHGIPSFSSQVLFTCTCKCCLATKHCLHRYIHVGQ